jgi:23S rRNA pseudouridine2605 synthase/16S rRNA pseudouridine516 synthase
LTTLRRHGNRPIVLDLFEKVKERIFPIGRLDFDTEGLLLMTNDGDLSYRLTHPKFQVEKVYEVWVDGRIKDGSDLARLRKGVLLEDGLARVKRATVKKKAGDVTLIQITLTEGKKREVKRMFQKIGRPVLKLKRVKFGGLGLEGLAPGSYRVLTPKEINKLEKSGVPKGEKNAKSRKK